MPSRNIFSCGLAVLFQQPARDQRHLFNSIVETSTGLRQARITLYSIDPLALADAGGGRTSDYKEFLKGVVSYEPVLPGDLALPVLAVQSGGRVFNSNNDLEVALAHCAMDANAFYVLSFDTARADRPDEYHSLAVTVDKPGIEARTRTGYYAQP
jgi:VWFA-related protein